MTSDQFHLLISLLDPRDERTVAHVVVFEGDREIARRRLSVAAPGPGSWEVGIGTAPGPRTVRMQFKGRAGVVFRAQVSLYRGPRLLDEWTIENGDAVGHAEEELRVNVQGELKAGPPPSEGAAPPDEAPAEGMAGLGLRGTGPAVGGSIGIGTLGGPAGGGGAGGGFGSGIGHRGKGPESARGPKRARKARPSPKPRSPGAPPAAPADPRETAAAEPPEGSVYTVWYGTNRKPVDPADPSRGYSAHRDRETLHYGSCEVAIPESHKIGSTGSPWWKRLLTLKDDRLKIRAILETSARKHWEELRRKIAAAPSDERHAVVFVHGYNVSFKEAALRAAQIGFDLQIRGAMAFFSWPSRGSLKGYAADAASIEASEGAIADYLSAFATETGAKAVHVVAHSMGNRGVLRAVNRIVTESERRSGAPFDQFILAAADVDVDVFRELSAAYRRLGRRSTLYVSERDMAVGMSEFLHDAPRVGFAPPITIVPGIDTVSVTNVDLTLLGHGYVAEARDVLHDMHDLIFHGAPPERRMGLRQATNEAGERYWQIGG